MAKEVPSAETCMASPLSLSKAEVSPLKDNDAEGAPDKSAVL
ncbi:MAG: hypothetical protein AAGA86_06450 [Bacteroidota bacterium]